MRSVPRLWRVRLWHLPYNRGKSKEKPQSEYLIKSKNSAIVVNRLTVTITVHDSPIKMEYCTTVLSVALIIYIVDISTGKDRLSLWLSVGVNLYQELNKYIKILKCLPVFTEQRQFRGGTIWPAEDVARAADRRAGAHSHIYRVISHSVYHHAVGECGGWYKDALQVLCWQHWYERWGHESPSSGNQKQHQRVSSLMLRRKRKSQQ